MLPTALVITVLGLVSNSLSSVQGKKTLKPDSKIARNVLEGKAEGYCSPSGPIESTHCLYETVESLNDKLFPSVSKMVEYPFFRHYKVDLFKECPFWYENGFCTNRDCGVETADESEIPEKWRTRALSEVRVSSPESQVSSCYFREQDFCYIEDDANQDGQYVDLALNPERFTGYAGPSAHHVWQTIYEENCFGLSEGSLDSPNPTEKLGMASMAAGMGGSSPALGFSKLSEGFGTDMIRSAGDGEMCEEKKVYYRLISGLHASISIHICNEYLDQQTGLWSPNLQCFINRLATHPERLSNVYFNAVLLLRAVARAAPYLEAYDIGVAPTGKKLDARGLALREDDRHAKDNFREVLDLARQGGLEHGFDEGDFFTGPDAVILKEQFKTHFRNVSRIMDCVGCDKCRLWGKLQVSGFGTALKILFELDEKALDPKVNPDLLQRSEVVALFNTLHRTSESLAAVQHFRQMYAETQALELEAAAALANSTTMTEESRNKASAWISTILGLLISALEAVRRSCRGCLDICWKTLEGGPLGEWLDTAREYLGSSVSKQEL